MRDVLQYLHHLRENEFVGYLVGESPKEAEVAVVEPEMCITDGRSMSILILLNLRMFAC
jgi:hypothetical protein